MFKGGKIKPMGIDRLKQLKQSAPDVLTPQDHARLLYDQVGSVKRVAQWTGFEYGWTREETRKVLAWDIENPTVTKTTARGRRGKPGPTVREVLMPEKVAEIRKRYAELGSVEKVADETGIYLRHLRRILADQVAEKMATQAAGSPN